MSFGHSGSLRFEVNKNSAGTGIFWQKDKQKTDQRKFGYKSKNLRHPIRRPDDTEMIEEYERAQEEEKKKFNRNNVDFINKNRQRYRQKSQEHGQSNGSTHIGPGTVTLTQDQLAALLVSLGGLKNNADKENPLKISIDASKNKIEVEKYESDSGGDDDVKINGRDYNGDDDDDDQGGHQSGNVGIYSLLDNGSVVAKPPPEPKKKKRQRDTDLDLSREREKEREEKESRYVPGKPENDFGGGDTARSTLDEVKKEAQVSHIPPTVPWKHMTVGERKRMQWAMEKAELQQEYDPWGRPGAGAPMGKQEVARPVDEDNRGSQGRNRNDRVDNQTASKEKALRQRQQEELQNEIEKLQREIREAEQKKRKEERVLNDDADERTKTKNRSRKEGRERKPIVDNIDRENARNRRQTNRDASESRRATEEKEEKKNENQVQIIIVNKKRDKGGKEEGSDDDDYDEDKRQEDDSKVRNDDSRDIKSSQVKASENEPVDSSEGVAREKGRTKDGRAPERKNKAEGSHFGNEEEDLSHLTKKEIERRKWLAELDKQREEQRMKKQQEKERDRAGVHDQWADRFVYHKSPQDVTPRYGKTGLSPRNQVSVLGREPENQPESHAPPAAMRSSMVIGAGTLNETRYDDKKAEEKRQWLEELERQREEQRRVKAEKRERERREDDGVWADRYQTDRQKLTQFAGTSSQGPPFMDYSKPPEPVETQRTNSAPQQQQPPLSVRASQEEPTTFLRGQGVYVDPQTRKEQEEKRKVHLEYQAQIKAQIEEKERQKKEERERKIREDMEEERKLQMERDQFLRQEENEQRKNKEREAIRQKQIAALKTAMDEAQERAQEEKNVKRMQHLQQRGHDVSQLKATYEEPVSRMSGPATHRLPIKGDLSEATTPRIKEYEISNIPGLGHAPSPPPPQASHSESHAPDPVAAPSDMRVYHGNHHQARGRRPMGQSYTKEPYVEDRVLTPSRFRNPSKPRDEPGSPRREFGTQTLELKDLQAILKSLPDDIQIEYKMRVEEALKEKEKTKQAPSRKVHSKSADEPKRTRKTAPRRDMSRDRPAAKEKPPKVNERPAWNQTKRKTVIKNSERDPFYQQKKEEAEARKIKRERQLQYLQELNKERIPSLSPTRARAVSPSDEGRRKVERGRRPADPGRTKKPAREESPNILSLINDDKTGTTKSKSPNAGRGRSSPPVPTVKHRTVAHEDDPNNPYSYTNSVLRTSQGNTRYGDASVATAPIHDGEFVPFMRTTEILDPAQADDPLAISRENSRMERARRAYHETHHPANKGRKLNMYQDREREAALKASQDPILNPQLVTEHPTARQDMILQQLSSLKQNLMQRRKELENFMSPSELEPDQGTTLKV